MGRCGPQYFDGPFIRFGPGPSIDEFEIECRQEGIMERGHDLARLLPVPYRWERQHADQITHPALKVLQFLCRIGECHLRTPGWTGRLVRTAVIDIPGGTPVEV